MDEEEEKALCDSLPETTALSVLFGNNALIDITRLKPEHFAPGLRREIFVAMKFLRARLMDVNAATVYTFLATQNLPADLKSLASISEIEGHPLVADEPVLQTFERMILYNWRRRRLADCHEKARVALVDGEDPDDVEARFERDAESALVREPDVVCLADVKPASVRWLWRQRIPLGKVTLVEGDPGVGKSYLIGAIAAAVASGHGLPGEQAANPRNVLLLTAEDGLADTVRPRLDMMGADVSRVFALEDVTAFDVPGLLRLEAAIAERQAAFVVSDPLIAYMPKTDIHRANEVRTVMSALARIAERQGCAIVCIRHLTKSHKGRAIYAGAGSIDFTASCRSVLLVGADPEDPTKRGIVQTKNNLSEFASGVGYVITNDGFFWMGDTDLTAARILTDTSEEARGETRDAVQFLRESLAEGPRPANEVHHEATTHGISAWALRKAREALGATSTKEGGRFGKKKQRWLWALQEDVVHPQKM